MLNVGRNEFLAEVIMATKVIFYLRIILEFSLDYWNNKISSLNRSESENSGGSNGKPHCFR